MKIKLLLAYFSIFSTLVFSQEEIALKFAEAKNLFDKKIYSEAYQIFSEIKKEARFEFDRLPLVYFYLGEIKFIQEKYTESAFDFENFVAKFPLDRNIDLALFRLGQIYFSLNKFQTSRKYFEKLISEKPENEFLGTSNFWIAETYFKENDFVNAEYFYLQAIKYSQTNELIEQTLFSLAFLYEKLGNYDKAEIYYDKLLFEYPNSKISPFALARVSLSYYKLGKYQKAINRLTAPQIEQLSEKDLSEARYILANCYYRLGKFSEANNVFKSLLDLSMNKELTRQIKYGYSWSLYQENKIEKAHQIMSELTTEDDSIAERATYWLGFFSKAMKKNLQAINEFKLYLKRFPVYRYADLAKFEIGMLYYLEKRFKDAEDYLFVALENSRDPKIRAKSSLILANIKLDRKDFIEAKTYFESAVSELEDEDDNMV
ncbi:MAG: tetratricopeptide repeat protein, partial [Ignavibacteria bacterium]|nr:tetratricopeptide repeat protein [Ignavibacteria bacterium]